MQTFGYTDKSLQILSNKGTPIHIGHFATLSCLEYSKEIQIRGRIVPPVTKSYTQNYQSKFEGTSPEGNFGMTTALLQSNVASEKIKNLLGVDDATLDYKGKQTVDFLDKFKNKTLISKFDSYQTWEGSPPDSFELNLEFNAFYDAKIEVMNACTYLEILQAPELKQSPLMDTFLSAYNKGENWQDSMSKTPMLINLTLGNRRHTKWRMESLAFSYEKWQLMSDGLNKDVQVSITFGSAHSNSKSDYEKKLYT